MSDAPSVNPLIKSDQASTIDAIIQALTWMCLQKGNDPEAHHGEWLQLETVRLAAVSLKDV
ncbi:hypothetical protein HER21_28730 [Pseudomonas sp. BGM005]|nr:hypothetical protein [Pseudomonas sp. BG5]